MPRPNHSGAPAYRRIKYELQKRIEGGELQAGDAVPSERDLARTHEVSLMTARTALGALSRDGVVGRRRGVGTFVAPPKIHFNRLASFSEQMASRGLPARSRILWAGVVEEEPQAATRLSLPAHTQLRC